VLPEEPAVIVIAADETVMEKSGVGGAGGGGVELPLVPPPPHPRSSRIGARPATTLRNVTAHLQKSQFEG